MGAAATCIEPSQQTRANTDRTVQKCLTPCNVSLKNVDLVSSANAKDLTAAVGSLVMSDREVLVYFCTKRTAAGVAEKTNGDLLGF